MIPYDPDDGLLRKIKGIVENTEDETFTFSNLLPRGYLSVSQIGLYQNCGMKYYFNYIEGRRGPPNHYMVQGRGVHKAGEMLHLDMIERPDAANEELISEEEMEEYYSELHDAEIRDVEDYPDDLDGGKVKDQALALVRIYRKGALGELPGVHGELQERIKPTAAERAVRVTLRTEVSEPVPFMGIIDLEQEFSVIDLKSKKKPAPQSFADNSIQLSLYSEATGKPDVGIHQLVSPSKRLPARYMRNMSVRPRSEIKHALNIVGEVATDIAAGRFRRTSPDNWGCTKKWCSYWDICRGKKS